MLLILVVDLIPKPVSKYCATHEVNEEVSSGDKKYDHLHDGCERAEPSESSPAIFSILMETKDTGPNMA